MTQDKRIGFQDLLPVGLLLGGLLVVARAWILSQPPASYDAREAELLRWSVLSGASSLMGEALVAGVAGSLVLVVGATRSGAAMRVLGVLVLFAVSVAFLGGLPDAAGVVGSGGTSKSMFGAVDAFAAVCAALVALIGLVLAHVGSLRTTPGLVAAALIGVGGPYVASRLLAEDAPTMTRRFVVADVVASVDSWSVLESRPGLAPEPVTMTPIVDLHADVADKPAIRMAPPCAVAFDVPTDAGICTLGAAAGADLSVIGALPQSLDALVVDYSVAIDDEVVWESRVEHGRMPIGRWAPEIYAWRHVVDASGQPFTVRPGQRVTLRTAFAPDQDLSGIDEARGLELGFGGVVLERTSERARTIARPDAPNVVYVVMDTQRADRLGCYGYPRNVSPNVDRLAERGTLFEAAYSTSSWTWPSTASLLTGMLPDEHGVNANEHCTLVHAHETVAEAFQRRGATTAAFSGNPLIVPARQYDQGFEFFDGSVPDFRMSDEIVPQALDWMRRHASVRFFLYLHLADPHTPHRPHPDQVARLGLGAPPEGWPENGMDGVPAVPAARNYEVTPEVRRYMSDLYDASVATGDWWFGEVVKELERLGLDDRTVVVFTADHGEGLLDHGMRGHGNSVFAEEVHVPLVIAGPGIPSRRRVSETVSNRHLAPTLAAFANSDLPLRDGIDLLEPMDSSRALTGTRRGLRGMERGLLLHGFRLSGWEVHWRERPIEGSLQDPDDVLPEDLQLYDVLSDPDQLTDLSNIDPQRARDLLRELQATLRDAREHAPDIVTGVGEAGMATLRNNGYAGDE